MRIRVRLLIYLAGVSGAVAAAARIDWWGTDLCKETIVWFLVSGLGLLVPVQCGRGRLGWIDHEPKGN